ncbi:hypothetical protein NX773_06080 [Massilia solisilvae]|uniref:Uncharacterized protein n=1 Tax=Massilia solisilvae TaxID=1811225 RepID=A0ABT2BGT3_9BURK|nr:hypothetical protein [Massilia solisilvae]MCS0607727.1 hypothetical protein [Massilia solisilvae]
MDLVKGVTVWVSAPLKYDMTYFNGRQTYTEQFLCIKCASGYVQVAQGAIDQVVASVAKSLSSLPPVPVAGFPVPVGQLLAEALKFVVGYYENASKEADGSVILELAPHYVGTKAGGLDITAWPFPGVDPATWRSVLSSARNALTSVQGTMRLADMNYPQPEAHGNTPRYRFNHLEAALVNELVARDTGMPRSDGPFAAFAHESSGIVPESNAQRSACYQAAKDVLDSELKEANKIDDWIQRSAAIMAAHAQYGAACWLCDRTFSGDAAVAANALADGAGDFQSRFQSCLKSKGMPVPDSAFSTMQMALATITALSNAVKQYGTAVTVAELVGAGVLSDFLAVAGALTAAVYLGACIGCAASAGMPLDVLPCAEPA